MPAATASDGIAASTLDGLSDTDQFFARLPPQTDFRAITESAGFVPVPPQWWVAVADVTDSTEAIARGRYKDVNTVGAMVIVGLLNAAPPHVELPFVFGGDGATVLIPSFLRPAAQSVLEDMQKFAQHEFGLTVKIGLVSVESLYRAGARLQIAKWGVSAHYTQALFAGGGLTLAEAWIKNPDWLPLAPPLMNASPAPDYRGFYCRWATIPSPHGENVSLLLRSVSPDETAQRETYRQVLDEIERIYGDAAKRHPIAPRQMRLAFSGDDLMTETRVQVRSAKQRGAFVRHLRFENAVTEMFMVLKRKTPAARVQRWFHGVANDAPPMEWGKHKTFIRETSDCQKVDGTLRMIIAGYPAQRQQLTDFLERGVGEKKLVYGLHVAGGALMTCLVFQPNGRQVHFVDGAGGGYALASRDMKARLAAL